MAATIVDSATMADGYGIAVNLLAVRHHNKDHLLFLESGPAY